MKRASQLLLALALMICCMVFAASADQYGDWQYEITSRGLTVTGYTGAGTEVVIPDQIDGYLVSAIGRRAFADQYNLRSVSIPEGVSAIAAEAFAGCSGLSNIYFNARQCTVPEVYTGRKDQGAGVFSGAGTASAYGLTVFFGPRVQSVPDYLFDTASHSGHGLEGHPIAAVTAVVFSNSVESIGKSAFNGCRLLESVVIGDGITRIGTKAFCDCTSLKSLALGESTTFIEDSAFYGCTALREIQWNEELGSIGESAFNGCVNLKNVELPRPLATIGRRAFYGCTGLQSLTIPESVTAIHAEAFYGTAALRTIRFNARQCTVPEVYTNRKEQGAGIFSGAGISSGDGLTVTFGPKVQAVPDYLFDTASHSGYGVEGHPVAAVTDIVFSDNVETIGARAFSNCQMLESVTIGDGVTRIGVRAFADCSSLKSLTLGEEVTFIDEAAFENCGKLKNIDWNSELGSIGASAFYGCTSLKHLELPKPLSTIGRRAFAECTSLQTLTIPETVTAIRAEAFSGDVKLNEIQFNARSCTVPEVNTNSKDHGAGIFSNAGSASSDGLAVIFGHQVQSIPANLFDTASGSGYAVSGHPYAYVTSVFVPAGVESIGKWAFANCMNLNTISIASANAAFGKDVFTGCTARNFNILCPYVSTAAEYAQTNNLPFTLTNGF